MGTRWASRPGITVIGDAAHLMPPVGEGANQAMLDAAELAGRLAANPADPDSAIRLGDPDVRRGDVHQDSPDRRNVRASPGDDAVPNRDGRHHPLLHGPARRQAEMR